MFNKWIVDDLENLVPSSCFHMAGWVTGNKILYPLSLPRFVFPSVLAIDNPLGFFSSYTRNSKMHHKTSPQFPSAIQVLSSLLEEEIPLSLSLFCGCMWYQFRAIFSAGTFFWAVMPHIAVAAAVV